jgi:hypothetical protein
MRTFAILFAGSFFGFALGTLAGLLATASLYLLYKVLPRKLAKAFLVISLLLGIFLAAWIYGELAERIQRWPPTHVMLADNGLTAVMSFFLGPLVFLDWKKRSRTRRPKSLPWTPRRRLAYGAGLCAGLGAMACPPLFPLGLLLFGALAVSSFLPAREFKVPASKRDARPLAVLATAGFLALGSYKAFLVIRAIPSPRVEALIQAVEFKRVESVRSYHYEWHLSLAPVQPLLGASEQRFYGYRAEDWQPGETVFLRPGAQGQLGPYMERQFVLDAGRALGSFGLVILLLLFLLPPSREQH